MLWEIKYEAEMKRARQAAAAEGRAAGMAEGRAAGMAEGRAEGRTEGRTEGRAQQLDELSRLADALDEHGRSGELCRAVRDADFRASLLQEFGIGE